MTKKLAQISSVLALMLLLCVSIFTLSSCGGDDEPLQFEGLAFANTTVTYDGTDKTIEVQGLPEGATVTYHGGNKTDVGTYGMTATITKDGYESKTLTATLTIVKASYDMSGVFFPDKSVAYNGESHSLAINGTLPEGVTVAYEGNGKTEAGEYTVTAKFVSNNPNYEAIPDMTATLTISKSSISGIFFDDAEFTYDGTEKSISVNGTLPTDVSVEYVGNGVTDAGTYTITAIFTTTGNYESLPNLTATITISKATYDMSGVKLDNDSVTYDGSGHSILVTGELPNGVTVSYVGNDQTTVGEYTITAKFAGDSKNYELIPDMTAKLSITKANYDMSAVKFENDSVVYNGQTQSIEITGTLSDGVTVSYENNSNIAVGEYTVTAKFSGDSVNYNIIANMTATLSITKATYDMSGVQFNDKTVAYSGEVQSILISGKLPEGVTVSYDGNGKTEAGAYTVTAKFTGDSKNYELIPDMTAKLTISKSSISGITFDDASFTYDGSEKSIAISGTLPSDVSVEYIGNGVIDAGTYTVTAKFTTTGNYENLPDLSATITIHKATYDMSEIKFDDKSVVYNGKAHSIEISGTLPKGVTVSYENNAQTEADEYTVTAKFSGDSKNYELIPDMTAKLTISKSSISGIGFEDAVFTYDGTAKSIAITGTLPSDVSVRYEGNGVIDAGTYTVTAIFTTTGNYENLPNLTAKITINKCELDITFVGELTHKYDGDSHKSLSAVANNLIVGDAVDILIAYDGDVIEQGEYLATATVNHKNYQLTTNNTIAVTVTRATHTVTFRQDGQTDVVKYVLDLATLTDIPTPVSILGYDVKWDRTVFDNVTGDIVVDIVKEPIKYTITYVLSVGVNDAINIAEYTVETELTALNNPSDSFGMKFAGWYTSPEFTTTTAVNAIGCGMTGDITLYGKYVSYRVESVTGFDVDYSSGTPKISAVVNNATTEIDMKPLISVSEGCTYKIYGDKYGKEPYAFGILPLNTGNNLFYLSVYHPNNSVYYTLYELHIYRLDIKDYTFVDMLSTEDFYAKGALEENSNLSVPSAPEHVGYIFNGWKLNGEGELVSFPYTLSEDVVFIADYTPIVYTITYELSGGEYSGELITEYTIESEFDLPVPTRKDYTFKGWSVGDDYNTIITWVDGNVGDLELYAYWQYDFVYTVENGEVTITDYLGTSKTECKIPETIDGYPVKHIGAEAFGGCTALESVIVPDSVVFIGGGAFSGCSSLVYVELPFVGDSPKNSSYTYQYPLGYIFGTVSYDGSTAITQYYYAESTTSTTSTVFYIPSGLRYVVINDGEILAGAFWGCSSLESITIPSDITEIAFSAFRGCSSLKSITIPEAVVKIGEYAFRDCVALEAVYAASLESWLKITFTNGFNANPLAFAGKLYIDGKLIDEVVIPESITAIPSYAFYGCESIANVVLHNEVTSIGVSAFQNCASLTSFEGGVGVISIGKNAFNCCSRLDGTLEFTSLTSVGADAFKNCSSLKSLVIGEGVQSISSGLLHGCSSLENVTLPFVGDKVKTADDKYQYPFGYIFGTASYEGSTSVTQYYYGSSTSNTTYTTYYIPTSLKSITITGGNVLYGAFYNLTGITEIVIGDDVENIVASSFYGCSALEKLTVPYIGTVKDATTANANTLFGAIFGTKSFDGALDIEQYYSESSYVTYYIPEVLNSVTVTGGNILYGSFYGCWQLSEIGIGNVGKIENKAFELCAFESVHILNLADWCEIEFATYSDNPLLGSNDLYVNGELVKDLVIPEGVTKVSEYAFYMYTNIDSVTVPESLTEVGNNSFAVTLLNWYENACYLGTSDNPYHILVRTLSTDVESCTIHNDTKYVNPGAFEGCTNLTYYTEDGLCYIGSENNLYMVLVKAESADITSITIKESTEYILVGAFDGCNNVTEIVIPSGIECVTADTFSDCTSITKANVPLKLLQYLDQPNVIELVIEDGDALTSADLSGYTNVKMLHIPATINDIEINAFADCSNLQSIIVDENNTNYCAIDGILYDKPITQILYVPKKICGDIIIPNGVTSIDSYAFANRDSLTSITIGNNVTNIGSSAFYSCDSLASITIPDKVTQIGEDAFEGCAKLRYNEYDNAYYLGNDNNPYLFLIKSKNTSITDCIVHDSTKYIGTDAFRGCSKLTAVTILDSVTCIGSYAFYGCSSLTSVYISDISAWCGISFDDSYANPIYYAGNLYLNGELVTELVIPDGITSIGGYAFYNCTSLTSVIIPDSVTSIGAYAFSDCSNLMNITIPDSVTSIGDNVFYNCTSLTSVTIGNGVKGIGDFAFYGCTSLTSITIPDRVTSIGGQAFGSCTGLTSIVIGNGVTSIGYYAFYGCTSLTSVYISDISAWCGISFDDSYANPIYYAGNLYLNAELLTELRVPNSVTSIGISAFENCDSLTSVIIPDSITSIGASAFENCDSLTSVIIPDSVTSIGSSAFQGCFKLVEVINKSSLNITEGSESYGWVGFYAIEVHSGESKILNKDGYLFYTYDGVNYLLGYTGEDSILNLPEDYNGEKYEIYQYAFHNRDDITEVIIPDSVTSIRYRAFYGCDSLTSVTIGNSVTSIYQYAFSGCTSLTSVIIPDSVTSIGYHAFYNCTRLTSVTIGSGITSIGEDAFYNCASLTSITIPDSVISIGEDAFSGCTSLTSVVIPDSVTSIGSHAFYGCTGLTSVIIGKGVTSIGGYAFRNCTSLTSVNFENPNGWWRYSSSSATSGTSISSSRLSDSSTAATYLNTYSGNYWKRS